MKRAIIRVMLLAALGVLSGCQLDAKTDIPDTGLGNSPEVRDVTVTPLVNGLNYPTSVRFITSDDPQGTGSGSVLKKGNILIANAGTIGDHAQSILEFDPANGSVSLFSSQSQLDINGEAGIDRPVGIAFPGPYPWVANATWCFGSVSVLDAAPGQGFDGPRSQSGEPISGPNGSGVYGCSDFHLTGLSITPAPGAANVPLTSSVTVRFSLPVDPSTISYATFEVNLADADTPTDMGITKGIVEGTYHFSSDLKTVTFVPSEQLLSSTDYTLSRYEVTLDTDILDIYGNNFDADMFTPEDEENFESYFTAEKEHTPPRVIAVHPGYYQQVSTDMAVILTFSEPIRQDSVDEHTFKLIKGDRDGYYTPELITGDKYYYENNRILAFIPDDTDFAETSLYYIFATGTLPSGFAGIQDRAGNGLDGDADGAAGGDYWSSFFTKGFDDAPYILSITPRRGETNVPVTSTVDVIFSEPLNSATITNRSFLLFWGDGQIPGIVTRADGYITATFTPFEPLPFDAHIDVILTAEIEDVEGNPLDGNRDGIGGDNYYGWFSTGDDPTNIPPQVASIQPAAGQTDVDIDTIVTVMFTKEVDPSTVNGTTFYLQQGASTFPSTVSMIAGNMGATLTPVSSLQFDQVYTVTVTDGITDLQGRALDGNYDDIPGGNFVSTFTTQIDPSSVPVYVLNISPSNGQANVSINTSVVATFSREINPASVWTGNFYIFDGGDTVLATITVAPDNRHATLIPLTPLAEGTVYHVQLLDTITDPGSIALDGDHDGVAGGTFNSQFTTGVSLNLVINEFLPSPNSDWDGDGTTNSTEDEWIELYNNSPVAADISGMYLGDSSDSLRFQFGATVIPAYGFVVVYGSDQGSLSLNNSGDTVYLVDSDGSTVIDAHTYPSIGYDISVRRVPDGSSNWVNSNSCAAPGGAAGCPSPGAANLTTASYKARPGSVTIDPAAPLMKNAGYRPLLVDNWGFGGITYGGVAPDTSGANNVQFFTSHPNLNDIFVFDFDSGYYSLSGYLPDLIAMPGALSYLPTQDQSGNALPGQGKLFIALPQWDSIAMIKMLPSGQIGQAGVTTKMDDREPVSFYPLVKDPLNPSISHPVDMIYDETSQHLFYANRGNGTIAEMTTDGVVVTIYRTNLGMDSISSIDVGTVSGSRRVIVSITGGPTVFENSGPHGTLYSFPLND